MTKLGIFVGEENWTFFNEIFNDLTNHFNIEVFKKKTYNIPLLQGRLNSLAYREGIRSILRRNDICFFEWASELLMEASQLPKSSVIVTRLHSFEIFEWAPKIKWDYVDKVIFVSQAMRKRFESLYPEHIHKTEFVYNGRPLDIFKPPIQRNFNFNLGMLCHITPIKRIYEVILMVYNLKAQGYRTHLHIAGKVVDLRYAAAIYRLVDKLNLQDSIIFYEYVTDSPAWLQNIDIFISNSYWEGQQVSLLEAMATGCYCLAHHWDGAEEILPPENLYFTEAELMQKIIEYSKNPEAKRQDGQTLMRNIALQKFDIERTKVQIRGIIEKVGNSSMH